MAQVNPLTRELLVKLVVQGPAGAGKTTCLQAIHAAVPESRGQLVSLATPIDRTLYFDYLPADAPEVRGHHVRLQLFTVPGPVRLNATRKLVLTGTDGLLFVADSRPEQREANRGSMENLRGNLEELGRSLEDTPHVFLLNQRDAPDATPVPELVAELEAGEAPVFEGVATEGTGVQEALAQLTRATLERLEQTGAFRTGRTERPPSVAPGPEGWQERLEDALAAAGGALAPGSAPFAPGVTKARGPSWAPLFPDLSSEVEEIEAALSAGELASALRRLEALADAELLAWAEAAGESHGGDRAGLLALAGIPADRWFAFRGALRRVSEGAPLDLRDALRSFALVIELRLRRP
ncbi:MAG: GTPase [Myxococcota bacterium]